MTQNDYPAAHSMDCAWFAVDDDGHVAYLSSGAEGPVPVAVPGEDHGNAGVELLLSHGIDTLLARGSLRVGEHYAWSDDSYNGGLFLLRDPARAPVVTSTGEFRKDHAPLQIAEHLLTPVRYDDVKEDRHRELHADGNCAGCVSANALAQLGIYEYGCHDYDAPPYAREAAPEQPMRLSELPPSVREQLKPVVLPSVRFATATALQPFEHVDSRCWGNETFVGSDGQSYPVAAHTDIDLRPEPIYLPTPQDMAAYKAYRKIIARHRRKWWQFWKPR